MAKDSAAKAEGVVKEVVKTGIIELVITGILAFIAGGKAGHVACNDKKEEIISAFRARFSQEDNARFGRLTALLSLRQERAIARIMEEMSQDEQDSFVLTVVSMTAHEKVAYTKQDPRVAFLRRYADLVVSTQSTPVEVCSLLRSQRFINEGLVDTAAIAASINAIPTLTPAPQQGFWQWLYGNQPLFWYSVTAIIVTAVMLIFAFNK